MAVADAELVQRTLGGDRRAFGALVERHKHAVFGLISRMVGSGADVEDIAQESFLRAYRALGTFRGDAQFGTWIYRIVWNCALDRREKNARRDDHEIAIAPPADGDDPPADFADEETPLPDEVLASAHVRKRLLHHLGQMPEHYRAVLTLYYYEQQSYEEIARVLDLPMNTVKVHLYRAKERLKKALVAEGDPGEWSS